MEIQILVFVAFVGCVYAQLGSVCMVPPVFREECGYAGISKNVCEKRNCCFDDSIHGVKWCFKKANTECWVLPKQRVECGYAGITEQQCLDRGCCFNPNVPNTTWCFKKIKASCK